MASSALATVDSFDPDEVEQAAQRAVDPQSLHRDLAVYYGQTVDPATLGWPPFLPVELALRESSPKDICAAYQITREEFEQLIANPAFKAAFKNATEMLQKEGMTFRVKARMQAEALLKTSWNLIHDKFTPASVKADLIKTTIRAAGLEPKESDRSPVIPLQINIQLG